MYDLPRLFSPITKLQHHARESQVPRSSCLVPQVQMTRTACELVASSLCRGTFGRLSPQVRARRRTASGTSGTDDSEKLGGTQYAVRIA
jgi:hypothetical protein